MADKHGFTLIKADEFQEILNKANDVVDYVKDMEVPVISCGLAGISLVRGCIAATGGDVEWWVNLLRNGPEAIVAIPMPAGINTLGKGPKGKQ